MFFLVAFHLRAYRFKDFFKNLLTYYFEIAVGMCHG